MRRPVSLGLLTALALAGCSQQETAELSPLAQEGQRIYANVCTACHHGNPNLAGAPGPAIANSSRALLEARVVHGTYPPGYTPKGAGGVMPVFPALAGKIDALHAYLEAVSEPPPDGPGPS